MTGSVRDAGGIVPFDEDEFRSRVVRLQRHMGAADLAALFVTTPPNIRYLTGFASEFWESPTRPWFVVVPASGDPVAVVLEIGAAAFAKTWVRQVRTWQATGDPAYDGTDELVDALRECTPAGARIGAEFGAEMTLRMPVSGLDRLRRLMDDRDLVDASGQLWATRRLKSEAEITRIRRACTLAGDMFDALPELVHVGDTEAEAVRRLRADLIARGVDAVPFMPGRSGSGGLDEIVSAGGHRVLSPGDVFFVDTGATVDGYFCDFDRLYAVDHVSDACARAHDALWRATEAGLAAAHPGSTTEDLWAAMQTVLAPAAGTSSAVGRFGHGLGLQLTEPPSLRPGDRTPLVPGMVLTLEPSLEYAPGLTLAHEENVVIREDGPELLTRRAPREMAVIGVAGATPS